MPITPNSVAMEAVRNGHAFVSFARRDQLALVMEVCQSFAIDNGAFSAWQSGKPVTDWSGYYAWAQEMLFIPSCDFAVIPDVIDGDEQANDELLAQWPLPRWFGAPVWHMHESIDRLLRLAMNYPRVCIGSSGGFSRVGSQEWWVRMGQAMDRVCPDGRPLCRLHGLRMLNTEVFSRLPLASADSTNIARNVGIDQKWRGTYLPPSREVRAQVMRARIEAYNAPARWERDPIQKELFA